VTESDSLHYFDFDWGEFRYAVARYIKLLICARWKCEPGFLPETDLAEWQLTNIEKKNPASAEALLKEAAAHLDRLSSRFLPGCSSGGFPADWDSESTPVGRLQARIFELMYYDYASDINWPLVTATDCLRRQEKVDWLALVDWGLLPAIRADLDQLPHPDSTAQLTDSRSSQMSAPRLTLDQASHTIILDGTPYSGIDPTAFQIFEAIWKAGPEKMSSTRLTKLRGLGSKNISRELNKLQEELRELVVGAGGSGYWIELPFKSCL
jgi:hypothetical protein